ncbi:hypothetical protein D3C81_1440760 [compost metagenome]
MQAEKLQLPRQAFAPLMVLEHQVDGFAQGRQLGLFQLIALAQAHARQALHEPVEFMAQFAAHAPAIVLHRQ